MERSPGARKSPEHARGVTVSFSCSSKYLQLAVLLGLAAASAGILSVRGAAQQASRNSGFQLRTSGFKPDGEIPARFTCDGENVSPALTWTDPPAGAHSLALIADDPDAPSGTWSHWVIYDLPARLRQLPEAVPREERLRDGGRQGINDFPQVGYGGPCPPPGKPHRYFFKLYALDTQMLNLSGRVTRHELEAAMRGHILAEARLMGRYGR